MVIFPVDMQHQASTLNCCGNIVQFQCFCIKNTNSSYWHNFSTICIMAVKTAGIKYRWEKSVFSAPQLKEITDQGNWELSHHSQRTNPFNYIFYLIHITLWRAGGWGDNLIIYVKCSETFDSYHGLMGLQNWKGVKSMTLIHYSWTQLLWCDASVTPWI